MSSSKDQILAAIRRNKPTASPLPNIPDFGLPPDDPIDLFTDSIEKAKGKVLRGVEISELPRTLKQLYPEAAQVWSADETLLAGNTTIDLRTPPPHLAEIDLVLIRGTLGVAENGAIWVPESALPQRVVPFITQHLIIVLQQSSIVGNMHKAYQELGIDLEGFGVFIAGPSKTADIEQSLVIGAHGPKSLTVCLL